MCLMFSDVFRNGNVAIARSSNREMLYEKFCKFNGKTPASEFPFNKAVRPIDRTHGKSPF